jgi:histidine triad (HIT) family protein
MAESCIFCRIAAGEIPARIAYQDDQVVAFHDLNPQAPTHVLIIPREHVATVHELSESHGDLLASMMRAAQQIAHGVGADQSGYRLVFNHGANAGQTVFHVHMHLLAGRQLGWPPG